MGEIATPLAIGAQTAVESAQAAQQIALLTQQLGILSEIAGLNRGILSGGGIIQGILGSSLDVLKGISDEIQKAQETVAPIIALVVEVQHIGEIIKGDVGLNLGALVDATRGISDTLKGSIGINISDAIGAAGQRTAEAITAQTDATKSVGQSIEAAGKAQADKATDIAEAIRKSGFWGNIDHDELARANARAQVCATPEALSAFLKTVEGVLEFAARELVCIFTALVEPTIKAVEEPVSDLFQGLTKPILDDATATFNALGQADPNTVAETGSKVLAFAIGKGLEAHVIGAIADLVHPTKYTGFPQLAAFLVDIAGFKTVGDAVVGERIRAALRIPARFAAQRAHRPNLPELRDAMEAWRKLAFSDQDFAQLVRFHGYPDTFIPFFEQVAEREPTLRDLAFVYDDNEVSDAYLARAVQRAGFRGENATVLATSLSTRANRSWRAELVKELIATVKDGLHDVSWLQANLRAVGLRPQTIAIISSTATLAQTREQTNELAKVWQTKAEQDVITLAEYRVALVSLGFTSTAVSVKVALVDAKLRGKVVKQEKAQFDQLVKKVQTERTQAAIQLFRKGLLSADQLHTALVGLGFVEEQARAIADLEAARRLPVNKPTVDHEAQATQKKIIEARTDQTLLLLRHDQINADQAFAMLLALGLDQDLAQAEVEKELARLKPPKSVVSSPTPARK